jgi:hypothetical protein
LKNRKILAHNQEFYVQVISDSPLSSFLLSSFLPSSLGHKTFFSYFALFAFQVVREGLPTVGELCFCLLTHSSEDQYNNSWELLWSLLTKVAVFQVICNFIALKGFDCYLSELFLL